MVQFRKSKKIGPVRITASKKGIGVSAGAGPVRVGLGADGKVRRTLRVPGTGIYDTKVIGQTNKPPPAQSHSTPTPPQPVSIEPRHIQPLALAEPIVAKGHDGTVRFDGWWIDIDRSGTLARLSAKINAYGSKRIPLDHLERIDWKQPTAIANGYLRFVLVGDNQPLSGHTAAAADANTVLVTKQQIKRFEPLRAALEQALASSATGAPPPPPLPPVPANWYPDPVDPALVRWWDGTTWTESTARKP